MQCTLVKIQGHPQLATRFRQRLKQAVIYITFYQFTGFKTTCSLLFAVSLLYFNGLCLTYLLPISQFYFKCELIFRTQITESFNRQKTQEFTLLYSYVHHLLCLYLPIIYLCIYISICLSVSVHPPTYLPTVFFMSFSSVEELVMLLNYSSVLYFIYICVCI